MAHNSTNENERRVLFLSSSIKDAQITQKLLAEEKIELVACRAMQDLEVELTKGVGAVIFAEEILETIDRKEFIQLLNNQPAWSDLPLLLLAGTDFTSENVSFALDQFRSLLIVQRPVRIVTLLAAVRAALRSRAKQYELRDLLDQLQLDDKRKDEFLTVLVHELRNPLHAISTGMSLLQSDKFPQSERGDVCDLISRQLRQMMNLVDDLSDISRVRQGKISIRKEPIRLLDILTASLETVNHLILVKQHVLQCDFTAAQDAVVIGDANRLQQVFSNLLTNAIKYTDPGGNIWLEVNSEPAHICVTIRDSGIGIPTELLPAIFGLFVQVDAHSPRAKGGLGIGLALVKRIVDLHNATIEAFSDGVDLGSKFVVRFPKADSVAER